MAVGCIFLRCPFLHRPLNCSRRPPSPFPHPHPHPAQVNYTLTLPYTATVASEALSYPVALWRDARSGHGRMDLYGSETIMLEKHGKALELVPRIDRQASVLGVPTAARACALLSGVGQSHFAAAPVQRRQPLPGTPPLACLQVCFAFATGGDGGFLDAALPDVEVSESRAAPVSQSWGNASWSTHASPVLALCPAPRYRLQGWEYGGTQELNGEQVELWQYEAR